MPRAVPVIAVLQTYQPTPTSHCARPSCCKPAQGGESARRTASTQRCDAWVSRDEAGFVTTEDGAEVENIGTADGTRTRIPNSIATSQDCAAWLAVH